MDYTHSLTEILIDLNNIYTVLVNYDPVILCDYIDTP